MTTDTTNHSIFFNETGRQDVTNNTNIFEEDMAPVDMLDFTEKKKHKTKKSNGAHRSSASVTRSGTSLATPTPG